MDTKSMMLAVTSRMLGYPDDQFLETRPEMLEAIRSGIDDPVLRGRVEQALESLYAIPLKELRELYVWTFDWKDKTGLYLTAHELVTAGSGERRLYCCSISCRMPDSA